MSEPEPLHLRSVTWNNGHQAIATLKSQEAKKVRDIGRPISETPILHDYGAGVEVRSLLPTELAKEIDGKLAVTDVDSRLQSTSNSGLTILLAVR